MKAYQIILNGHETDDGQHDDSKVIWVVVPDGMGLEFLDAHRSNIVKHEPLPRDVIESGAVDYMLPQDLGPLTLNLEDTVVDYTNKRNTAHYREKYAQLAKDLAGGTIMGAEP